MNNTVYAIILDGDVIGIFWNKSDATKTAKQYFANEENLSIETFIIQ